jgi:enediyne biosynthesis protein E4
MGSALFRKGHVGTSLSVPMAVLVLIAWSPAGADFPIRLDDVTGASGIDFVHTDGGSGRRYIVETVSAGLALFDYDGDGQIDVYLLNGAPLRGTVTTTTPRNGLYRNSGDFRFTDVTEQARVGDPGYGLGVATGDFDNDGDVDLYLNNFGPNVFYRNNGDGTFTDITQATGTGAGDQVGAGAAFLDANGDGNLDLFVSNYLEFSYDAVGPTQWRGVSVYPAPEQFPAVPDIFFRNNGDGTFTDVSQEVGIASEAGRGMGIACVDCDNDGHIDIFINNDSSRDFLFRNDGQGRFEEVGILSGTSFTLEGVAMGSMGVAAGDYDNDGWLDFYVTSYQRQFATLFRNLGDGLFEDVTRISGAGAGTYHHVTWGCEFVDFANDGNRDLFVATGHLMDLVEQFDDTTAYEPTNLLLMNTGQGRFVDVSAQAGTGMRVERSSRGTGFDDLDGDGFVDVVILNSRQQATVLRNRSAANQQGLSGAANRWLQIRLRGITANRDAIGARVRVVAGKLIQIAEVQAGRGYQSSYGTTLSFGLGNADRVDQVEIQWPGGGRDVLHDLPVNQRITVCEGGQVVLAPR